MVRRRGGCKGLTLVADTNVLIGLFVKTENTDAVKAWRVADKDWRLPSLWICEFRAVHLKYLRAGQLSLSDALENLLEAERLFAPQTVSVNSAEALRFAHQYGCSSYDAEFVVLSQQLSCPLLTFDRKLLELFPEVAVKPDS
jgi:predicted nucleic acid-binding protein